VTHARDERGFTVVEIVVAVLVLMVGITALVGSSALVTRQVGRGRIVTIANQMASQKLDQLRALAAANRSGGRCTDGNFVSSGPTTTRGVTLQWFVTGSGTTRTVQVNASYPVPGGTRSFSLSTTVGCA
jgi:Tfp pilus assembly protein PilV